MEETQKLNINLENCLFPWFMFYNCIMMHDAENIKNKTVT